MAWGDGGPPVARPASSAVPELSGRPAGRSLDVSTGSLGVSFDNLARQYYPGRAIERVLGVPLSHCRRTPFKRPYERSSGMSFASSGTVRGRSRPRFEHLRGSPRLIQYACERCKTRFVLPPSRRELSVAGRFRALSLGLGKTLRFHEGLVSGYDTARRQLLARMDDEAYQSFVQSFRFCHECRQFVCNECWSAARRSCLTCVAKSMTGTVRPRPPFAPTGPKIPRPAVASAPPRRGRLRGTRPWCHWPLPFFFWLSREASCWPPPLAQVPLRPSST